MATYELLFGTHADENGVKYRAPRKTAEGTTLGPRCFVESDKELDKSFTDGRFRKVGPDEKIPANAAKGPSKTEASSSEAVFTPPPPVEEEETAGADEGLGQDVSETFPEAAKGDLKVFYRDHAFVVVDADKPDVPLNDYELPNPDTVRQFIKTYVGE